MAVIALRWFKAALVVQILLVAYWLTMEVVSLYPWNDIASRGSDYDLRASIAVNALQLLAYTAIFAFGVRPLGILSAVGYGVYLAIQLWLRWKPYLWGADPEWQSRYAQLFSKTIKVLPAYGTHLPPDAQHLTLQGLTLVTLIVTAMAASRMRYL